MATVTSSRPQASSKEAGYRGYLQLLAVVLICWGVVPSFAELGGLPGDVTTMYVNIIATIAVAGIITARRGWHEFVGWSLSDYAKMVGIGIVWPLIYSVAYFGSVVSVGAAMTSILNYTWPVFYLVITWVVARHKLRSAKAPFYIGTVMFAVSSLLIVLALDNKNSLNFAPMIVLGLVAALTQGFYSVKTEDWTYPVWVITFVTELVTAVGVTIWVSYNGTFVIPSLTTLAYLAVIGAISNGIGFAAFLRGNQISGSLGLKHKGVWLIGLCLVPLAQVLVALVTGLEVRPLHLIGVALIMGALVLYRVADLKNGG